MPVRTGLLAGSRGEQLVSQPPLVQAKLTINQPNDRYEQEADRIAKQVLRMPEPHLQQQVETEKEEELIQAKETSEQTPYVSPIVQTQINSLRGGGKQLSPSLRNFFELRFGHDFSRVRVHTDAKAAESARALDAQAYTIGRDVVFGKGQYVPGTSVGRRLLAHELSHVIQQSGPYTLGIREPYKSGRIIKEQASNTVQREGDFSQIPTGIECPTPGPVTRSAGEELLFSRSNNALSTQAEAQIGIIVNNWRARGMSDIISVDGYASVRGPEDLNWRLSCERALTVETELINQGVPPLFITIAAHGETDEFSFTSLDENRRVVVSMPVAPVPPTPEPPISPPPAPSNTCGPDITSPLQTVFGKIKSQFKSWNKWQKVRACGALVGPLASIGGIISLSDPRMAWDIRELYLVNTAWLYHLPHGLHCGVPASGTPGTEAIEDQTSSPCGNSVEVNNRCFLAGTANFGTFGIMCKECYDFAMREIMQPEFWINLYFNRTPPILPLNPVHYTETGMDSLILGWKIFTDDPQPPMAWARATYRGGPMAVPSNSVAENRANCTSRCNSQYSRSAPFNFIWEPNAPR